VSGSDAIRRRRALEHAVMDEHLAGRIGRREFLRYAATLGLSVPLAAPASRLARAAAPCAAPAARRDPGRSTAGVEMDQVGARLVALSWRRRPFVS
jgi:peptide/nickel transport system substrate-binding protein